MPTYAYSALYVMDIDIEPLKSAACSNDPDKFTQPTMIGLVFTVRILLSVYLYVLWLKLGPDLKIFVSLDRIVGPKNRETS